MGKNVAGILEIPQFLQVTERRSPIALLAGGYLGGGFRHVGVQQGPMFLCPIVGVLVEGGGTGVDGVGGAGHLDAAVASLHFAPHQRPFPVEGALQVRDVADTGETDDGPETGLFGGSGPAVDLVVHVVEKGTTTLDQLDHAQPVSPEDVPLGQFGLDGEYFSEPGFQCGQIILVVAFQFHGDMGVGIDEGWHGDHAGGVEDTVGVHVFRCFPYEVDMGVVNADVGPLEVVVLSGHRHDQGVSDECIHVPIVAHAHHIVTKKPAFAEFRLLRGTPFVSGHLT